MEEEVMGNEEAAGNPLPAGKKRGERYEQRGTRYPLEKREVRDMKAAGNPLPAGKKRGERYE